jgi:RNA polymerase sigma factor (sigma-70 family)
MSAETNICVLGWDLAVAGSVDVSQRWLLSAMQTHGEALVTMLWRILGNEQDVCDAYQQTFLNLAHLQDRRKPNNVQAYLFRTAANAAISMLRRKKIRQQSIRLIASNDSKSHSIDYAHELDTKLLQERLRSAVSRLPEYLREVVILRDLAELPYAGVGKILGISAATARVYRSKAITLLAVLMAKMK